MLKKDYDKISSFLNDGKLYGITNLSQGKSQYDILDIKGNIYYQSKEAFVQPATKFPNISSKISSFANKYYGLTMPIPNEFNIIDFESSEELLDKNYKNIKIVKNWDEKQTILFELQISETLLSIFDPISKQLIINDFQGKVEYRKGAKNVLLKCFNEEKLINYFDVESREFIFPIWINSSMKIKGQENMHILKTGVKENLMYGIYDVSTKTFFKEMSDQKIIEESGLTMKTKKRYHVVSYYENGKKVKIKFK